MKRRDQGKTTLVEFMRSIKFAPDKQNPTETECATHFAHFNPSTRAGSPAASEEAKLVRSAN
ncbi:MAG: hypothetical protein ACJAYC_000861 [Halieaceae bacterium]|jgi:hypothetical protein